jgi:chemotaxis protein histidine kinase CheA
MSTPDFVVDQDIIRKIAKEFIVETVDTIDEMGRMIEQVIDGAAPNKPSVDRLRREAHTLKGLGRSFGFPSISAIAHRLEDYISDCAELTERQFSHVHQFLDRMHDIAEAGTDPGDEMLARIVRVLPTRAAAKMDYEPAGDELEILLVASSSVLRHAVEQPLHKRGYRVFSVKSPFDVFETAIRTRPDMIVCSAMMDGVGGVDIAGALRAMKATKDIPVVLLTSFERSHPELARLPKDAALIRHDRDIDEEIAAAVKALGLEG